MWDNERYVDKSNRIRQEIINGSKNPFDFMLEYKESIYKDDFEYSKAITEVLKEFKFNTSDTHAYIDILNK